MSEVCPGCGGVLAGTVSGRQCPACVLAFSLAGGAPEVPAGARPFGHYELLEELGRGGMGVVYRAWEPRLERAVALKLLLAGPFASDGFAARFKREARIAARLRHPNIVAVHDAGQADDQPYYTMELVEGRSLAALVQSHPLPPARAASYLATIAQAVDFAHGQGVLHCDLKPSNILLAGDDRPKVADFGLARLWREAPGVTVEEGALGSPSFMAPEQAAGRRGEIGPATDVYALGAMLYHVLTGRPPHQGATLGEVLAQVRDSPVVSPRLLNVSVSRDLETICLKCLEKEPGRRYASAAALADDLLRYGRGETVLARPVSGPEKAWRWARRNRALTVALAGIVLAVMGGMAGVLWQMHRNRLERERVEMAGYTAGIHAAYLAASEGDYPLAKSWLSQLIPARGRPDLRGFEWRYLWALTDSEELHRWQRHDAQVTGIAFTRDGRTMVTTGFDGFARVSDIRDNWTLTPRWSGPGVGRGGAFAPDGSLLVTAAGRVMQRDAADMRVLWEVPGDQLSVSADGSRLAVVSGPPFLWKTSLHQPAVFDVATRLPLGAPKEPARTVAISPDGRVLAAAVADGRTILWDVAEDREISVLPSPGKQHALAFSGNGRWLATSGRGDVSLWDLSREPPAVRILPHPRLNVWSITFAPDSSVVATTCSDRGVRLWATETGAMEALFHGHADEVWSAAFHPDGRHLATGGKDGAVFLWDVERGRGAGRRIHPHIGWSRPIPAPGDGPVFGSTDGPKAQVVWDSPDGATRTGPEGWVPCGISRDGTALLLWSSDAPFLCWWHYADGSFGSAFPGADPRRGLVAFQSGVSTDGRFVFQLQSDGRLIIWDAESASQVREVTAPAPEHVVAGTALYSDRTFVLSRTGPRHAWVLDLESGVSRELIGHREDTKGVAISPDGTRAATASSDGTVRVWDARTAEPLQTFRTHPESASDVAFSPDGRTLAAIGTNQSVSLRHLATGSELFTISMPDAGSFLAFSSDGLRLAVARELEYDNTQAGIILLEAPVVSTGDDRGPP